MEKARKMFDAPHYKLELEKVFKEMDLRGFYISEGRDILGCKHDGHYCKFLLPNNIFVIFHHSDQHFVDVIYVDFFDSNAPGLSELINLISNKWRCGKGIKINPRNRPDDWVAG